MNNVIRILFLSLITLNSSCTNNNVYLIVLAGGAGERLWPLSKKDLPKQFLKLNSQKTLLENTLERLDHVKGNTHKWAVITQEFEEKIQNADLKLEKIIVEPDRRDTGPAILLACLHVAEEDPEAIVVFVPTDHYIPEHDLFAQYLNTAIDHAATTNDLTLLGIKPTYPATGYGYLIYKKEELKNGIAPLTCFREKPNQELAKEYIQEGNALWNAGIFCARASNLIDAYRQHAHEVYDATTNFHKANGDYNLNPKISVDFAIAEKYPHQAVVPAQIKWSDVGDLKTFLTLMRKKNNSHLVSINAANNLIHTQKELVTLIGVHDLCIVETDKELLIIPQSQVQRIKDLVSTLKENEKLEKYL